MDAESAQKNVLFLNKHDLDLSKALQSQKGSPLDHGSDFMPPSELKQLFGRHPNWHRLEKILSNGSEWPLKKLSKNERISDLKEAILFGNHKGANNNQDMLRKLVEKDVNQGFRLVLPLDNIERIP